MKVLIRFLAISLYFASSMSFSAGTLKLFNTDSLEDIKASHEGKPFLLMLWSLDCPPCLKELKGLSLNTEKLQAGEIVLISTDGPANQDMAEKTIHDFNLESLDNWIFANDYNERLRYLIDPNWFGELPRTYFYDKTHKRFAKSGGQSAESLFQWLSLNRQ